MDGFESNWTTPEYCNDSGFSFPSFVIIGIIAAVLVVFGIAANVVVIKIMSGPNFRCPTTIVLIALAVIDIVFLLISFFMWPASQWLTYFGYVQGHHAYIGCLPWLYPMSKAVRTAVAYVTMAAAFERLLAFVCPPGCRCCRGRLCAYILVATAIVCSTLLNASRFFETVAYRDRQCPAESWNGYTVVRRPVGAPLWDDWRLHRYMDPMRTLVGDLWPFAALCAIAVLIAVGSRRRANSWSYAHECEIKPVATVYDRQLTAIVLGAVALYLLYGSTPLFDALAPALIYRLGAWPHLLADDLSHLLAIVNSSAKLPVYWALSDEFRRRMRQGAEDNAIDV